MHTRIWLLPLISMFLLQGCTSIQCGANKGQFLEHFDRFMGEAEHAAENVTDAPWKLYDEQLELYILDCYDNFKNEMSWSDRTTVVMRVLKYYNWRYGSHMVYHLQDEEIPLSVYIWDEMIILREEGGEDIEEIVEEEWIEVTNVFLEDLDSLRRQLLETLEHD